MGLQRKFVEHEPYEIDDNDHKREVHTINVSRLCQKAMCSRDATYSQA